jgi:hypothetical protein
MSAALRQRQPRKRPSLICRSCVRVFEDARAYDLHRIDVDGRARRANPESVGLVPVGSIFDRPRVLHPPSQFGRGRR